MACAARRRRRRRGACFARVSLPSAACPGCGKFTGTPGRGALKGRPNGHRGPPPPAAGRQFWKKWGQRKAKCVQREKQCSEQGGHVRERGGHAYVCRAVQILDVFFFTQARRELGQPPVCTELVQRRPRAAAPCICPMNRHWASVDDHPARPDARKKNTLPPHQPPCDSRPTHFAVQ